jgi:hypothetical protein
MRSSYLLVASLVAVFVVFWYDLAKGLITIPCHHSGIDGWLLCLVEAFNLIEFFGVAALFGWLTFTVASDEVVERLGTNKAELIGKLNTIGDYFIISFVLYGIAALADYLFFHYTVFGPNLTYFFAGLTFVAFAFGTLVLAWPAIYVWRLQRGKARFVQQVDYALVLFVLTISNIMALVLVLPEDVDGRLIVIFPSIPTIAGLFLAMTRSLTLGTILKFVSLLVLSWLVLAVLVALGITSVHFLS